MRLSFATVSGNWKGRGMLMNRQEDIAVLTKVSLARNLRDYPFPGKLNEHGKKAVNSLVWEALKEADPPFSYIDMDKLSGEEAVSLAEQYLASAEFVADRKHKSILMRKEGEVSVMLNEEDHLRIQVIRPGLDLDGAWRTADGLDSFLDKQLVYAFDKRLGYLTQCPDHLGTGLRAIVVLHLPALQENGVVGRLAANLSKLGISLRAVYPEGSASKGAMYHLSNRGTLGLPEEEALQNLQAITTQLAQQERSAREAIRRDLEILDAVGRSLGILQGARLLSLEEFMHLISNVRLGISLGVIDNISYEQVNALLIKAQPATLMQQAGRKLSLTEQESKRAELVKQLLGKR